MSVSRYLRKNLLSPPYPLLPLLVFAYIAICFLIHPFSPLRTGLLADPDDYMRLNEVVNWLQGQGWYDLSQPRLSPGSHTIVHWSRLVDLPIALCMLPFIKLIGWRSAALAASMIVPMTLLGIMLALIPALARSFVGSARANLATLLFLFAPMTLFNFTPGRVDHHGWQTLIAGFGLYCLQRILSGREGWRYSLYAAAAFACGLWIGTEALPWLLLFIACLTLAAAWMGGVASRNAALFGAALPAAIALLLPLALPPEQRASLALSWFSAADLVLAALAGSVCVAVWLAGCATDKKYLRLGIAVTAGLLAGVLFLYFVPEAIAGPFADYDDFNSTTALDNISEARPFYTALWPNFYNHMTFLPVTMNFIHACVVPLLALVGVVGAFITSRRSRCFRLWRERVPESVTATRFTHGAFLLVAFVLMLFWQVRVGWFMQLFALAPLTWLLCAGWDKIGGALKGRARFAGEVVLFLVLAPLPVLLIPSAYADTPFASGVLLFPAARTASPCPLKPVVEFLSWSHDNRLHTILSGANEGPELLFRTPYNVIAANFNVAGNRDVFDFFNARDDKKALVIARRWKADLVLTCRSIPPFYVGLDRPKLGGNMFLRTGADGKLHLVGNPRHPALLDKLVNGTPPAWLKPVEIPGQSDYLLFEVRPPKSGL